MKVSWHARIVISSRSRLMCMLNDFDFPVEYRTADPGGEVVRLFGKVEYDHRH